MVWVIDLLIRPMRLKLTEPPDVYVPMPAEAEFAITLKPLKLVEMRLTLVVMHLTRVRTIEHIQQLHYIGITSIALESISCAIKAKD